MFWNWSRRFTALKDELSATLCRERKLATEKAVLAVELAAQQQRAADREGECEKLRAIVRKLTFFTYTLNDSQESLLKMTDIFQSEKLLTPAVVSRRGGEATKELAETRSLGDSGANDRQSRYARAA